MRHPALGALVIALLALVAYWGVWEFQYLSFDDPDYVSENPVVQKGLSLDGIRWAFTSGHAANWHPLTWISHMVDRSLFGPGPAGPHAMNLALHVAASLLLLGALRAMGISALLALLAAGLFAVHPMRLESVAWVAERKDVLSALFGWAALWSHVEWVKRGDARLRFASIAALALGLLAKPMLVSWPLLLVVVDRCFLARALPLGGLLREKWPHFALAIASAVATVVAQAGGGSIRTGAPIELIDRIANAIVALARYPAALAWPRDLAFFYPHPSLLPSREGHEMAAVAAGIVFLAGIAWIAWRLRRAEWIGGWLWYLLTVGPVLGLLQVGPQAWADRYSAIPTVGVVLAVGSVLASRQWPRGIGVAAVAIALGASTLATNADRVHWVDDFALYGRAIEVTDENWVAHGNLARAYQSEANADLAEHHYQQAMAAKPDDPIVLYNLGTFLALSGRDDEAISLLRSATEHGEWHSDAHYNLGQLLARRGDFETAAPLLERAHALAPHQPDYRSALANVLRRLGRRDEAIEHIEAVKAEWPDHAEVYDVEARVWYREDPQRAVAAARLAVEKSGGRDDVYLETLAQCLSTAGNAEEAAAVARRAIPLANANGNLDRVARLRALAGDD